MVSAAGHPARAPPRDPGRGGPAAPRLRCAAPGASAVDDAALLPGDLRERRAAPRPPAGRARSGAAILECVGPGPELRRRPRRATDVSMSFAARAADGDHRAERRRQVHHCSRCWRGRCAPPRGGSHTAARTSPRCPPTVARAAGLVRTFQLASEFKRLTVMENLITAIPGQRGETLPRRAAGPPLLGRAGARRRRTARARCSSASACSTLGDRYAGELSGGQRRLVEIMRSLMAEPEVLLLDEPMAGVHPRLAHQIGEQLVALARGGPDRDHGRARAVDHGRVLRPGHRDGRGPRARRGHDVACCARTRRSWRPTLSDEPAPRRGRLACARTSSSRATPAARSCTASRSRSRRARSSRSSAPTGRARARC